MAWPRRPIRRASISIASLDFFYTASDETALGVIYVSGLGTPYFLDISAAFFVKDAGTKSVGYASEWIRPGHRRGSTAPPDNVCGQPNHQRRNSLCKIDTSCSEQFWWRLHF